MAYVDVFVIPVPRDGVEAYRAFSEATRSFWTEEGCLGIMEAIGDDVPEGELTSFARSVRLKAEEVVAVGWIVWPDKATRDKAGAKMRAAPPPTAPIPFDGKRMFWGGFSPILQWNAEG